MENAASMPPDEVLATKARDKEDYIAWRAATDLRAPYRVAPEFLAHTKQDAEYESIHSTPLIVFINARSGGRVGAELANVLSRALGRSQVFDLSHHRPDTVLAHMWKNFDEQERLGNPHAAQVRNNLRILACGGDGTVAWIIKVIKQLGLQPQPPVAVMPLGTGNDLARSFMWGAEFDGNWIKCHASVYSTLKRVADARVVDLDCWRLRLALPDVSYQPAKTYAITQLPAHHLDDSSSSSELSSLAGARGAGVLLEGMFWNYFSVGADAQAAYNFHHLRDNHPRLASNRVANQFWYSAFSCTSGWFCGSLPSVSNFVSIDVLQPGSETWTPLAIPSSIKALVLVNLQSYGGGRNIWGTSESKKKHWRQPNVADGVIEVVGFTHGYHALAVMSSGAKLAHGKRLAQVSGIRMALRAPAQPDGTPGRVFMQLDGEPWMQEVPAGSNAGQAVLEVVHAGTSKLLANTEAPEACAVKKMTDLLTPERAASYLQAAPAVAAAPATPTQQLELTWQQPSTTSRSSGGGCGGEQAAMHSAELPGLPLPAIHSGSDAGGVAAAASSSCSDPGTAPVSTSMLLSHNRRSLQVEPGSSAHITLSSCSVDGVTPASSEDGHVPVYHVPSALSSPGHLLGLDCPSAVAVIEAVSSPTLQGLNCPRKPLHLTGDGRVAAGVLKDRV